MERFTHYADHSERDDNHHGKRPVPKPAQPTLTDAQIKQRLDALEQTLRMTFGYRDPLGRRGAR